MPLDASKTREKLIDEAARAFAANGVYGASPIEEDPSDLEPEVAAALARTGGHAG